MHAPIWIDTHAHMDDPRLLACGGADAVRQAARAAAVGLLVIPAVAPHNFAAVHTLAHRWGDGYALGIHPMHIPHDMNAALATLAQHLHDWADDPHLVAVGEIGIDLWAPHLRTPAALARQQHCLHAQLQLARQFDLPVLLHMRRAVDMVLHQLRRQPVRGGVAHAFSGSAQQAQQCVAMGLKLGFGGAMTYARATRLHSLARTLPLEAMVLETDAPDMPPHWLYTPKAQRLASQAEAIHTPQHLAGIGRYLAQLRQQPEELVRAQTTANAHHALPRLRQMR